MYIDIESFKECGFKIWKNEFTVVNPVLTFNSGVFAIESKLTSELNNIIYSNLDTSEGLNDFFNSETNPLLLSDEEALELAKILLEV